MAIHGFIVLTFILHILIVQFAAAAARFHINEEEEDDNEYRFLKRFLFPKSTKKPSTWSEKNTYSPSPLLSGACISNPCEHGSICIPKGQMTYECKCVGPWRGISCGTADACYKYPCQNGGTCLNVHDDFWCKCTTDYYGVNCQTKFYSPSHSENHCRSNICNTGQCISLKTTYYCQCPNDRYGEHCDKRFSKREVSSARSYYNLLDQLRRRKIKYDMKNMQKHPDAAYYDPKNGIYF